jgi:hypothetical protein
VVGASAGNAAAPTGPESHPSLQLTLDQSGLDLEARDVPLATVLREIAIESGFALEIRGSLDGGVSRSLEGLTLVGAVRRLLGDLSFVIVFAGAHGERAAAHIRRLIVYGDGAQPHVASRTAESAKGTAKINGRASGQANAQRTSKLRIIRRLNRDRPEGSIRKLSGLMLNDEEPFVREAAANVLSRFKGEGVADALVYALADKEDSVRRRAIVGLGRVREAQVVAPLIDVLRWDYDEESRILAAKAAGRLLQPRDHRCTR